MTVTINRQVFLDSSVTCELSAHLGDHLEGTLGHVHLHVFCGMEYGVLHVVSPQQNIFGGIINPKLLPLL